MKVLSYLNVSNISSLEADSGYVFSRSVLEELFKCGHEIVFIGPQSMPNLAKEIKVVGIDFPHGKYGVRFGLPWVELQAKLASTISDVDVVIVNQSELTVPFGMMIYEMTGRNIPCVTYYHYIAVQEMQDNQIIFDPSLDDQGIAKYIWRRQVESAEFSVLNIIGSQFGKTLFLEASDKRKDLEDKFVIIPPPVQNFATIGKECKNDRPVILYNHRLYEHYGTREIFQVFERLSKEHVFKVLVTDPTHKRSAIRDKLDNSVKGFNGWIQQLGFVEVQHFETQRDYYHAIVNVDIALAPWRKGALWSMAMADAMSVGVPVLAPNEGAYLEVVGDQDLIFFSSDDLYQKLKRLLSDENYLRDKGLSAKKQTQNISAELIGERFEQALLLALERSGK